MNGYVICQDPRWNDEELAEAALDYAAAAQTVRRLEQRIKDGILPDGSADDARKLAEMTCDDLIARARKIYAKRSQA